MINLLQNSRGVALILTILIVSIIVAVTLQFNTEMRTHAVSAGNIRHELKALYVAKTGISYGLALLWQDQQEEAQEVDTLSDAWAGDDSLDKVSSALISQFPYILADPDQTGPVRLVQIEDLSGKIPINRLTDEDGLVKETLRRFLKLEEFNLESEQIDIIMDSVVDWIDKNDKNTDPFHQSEEDYYMGLEEPYHCKNGPLDSPEELLLVKGMTPELFYGKKEEEIPGIGTYITAIQSGNTEKDENIGININTADSLVLMSLHPDLYKEMVEDMIQYRADAPLETLSKKDWYHNDGAGVPKDIKFPEKIITTSSKYFRITSTGCFHCKANEEGELFGGIKKQVLAVVERNDKGCHILSWKME